MAVSWCPTSRVNATLLDALIEEMHNGGCFCCLHDSFICRGSDILHSIYNSLHPLTKPPPHPVLDALIEEMHNGANFCCLHDSFICCGSDILHSIYNSLHPLTEPPTHPVSELTHIAQSAWYILPSKTEYLKVLLFHPLVCIPLAISCLSHVGCYILSLVSLSCRILWAILWGVL